MIEKFDIFWAEAIETAKRMGVDLDSHGDVVVPALVRRTMAVHRMSKAEPFSPAWEEASKAIARAESVIYSYVAP